VDKDIFKVIFDIDINMVSDSIIPLIGIGTLVLIIVITKFCCLNQKPYEEISSINYVI
jgi:hypothetical protein